MGQRHCDCLSQCVCTWRNFSRSRACPFSFRFAFGAPSASASSPSRRPPPLVPWRSSATDTSREPLRAHSLARPERKSGATRTWTRTGFAAHSGLPGASLLLLLLVCRAGAILSASARCLAATPWAQKSHPRPRPPRGASRLARCQSAGGRAEPLRRPIFAAHICGTMARAPSQSAEPGGRTSGAMSSQCVLIGSGASRGGARCRCGVRTARTAAAAAAAPLN